MLNCIKSISVKELSGDKNGVLALYAAKFDDESHCYGHIAVLRDREIEVIINGFMLARCITPFYFRLSVEEDKGDAYIRIWTDVGIFEPEDIVDVIPAGTLTTPLGILRNVLCYVEHKARELCGAGLSSGDI